MAALPRSRTTSWESRIRLYDSIILKVLLYCTPVWGLRYGQVLERVQVFFLKRLLLLPTSIPDCYLRLEAGRTKLNFYIFKHCLNWLSKLYKMPDHRLPKLCFKRCMQLQGNSDSKFNWCTQVKSFFQDIDCMHVWNTLDGVKLKTHYTIYWTSILRSCIVGILTLLQRLHIPVFFAYLTFQMSVIIISACGFLSLLLGYWHKLD